MMELNIGGFVLGVLAIAAPAPCVLLACFERPPERRVSPGISVAAAMAAAGLLAGAVLVIASLRHFGLFGLLVGGAELCAAAAIWSARSRRGGGGGGWPRGDEPHGSPPQVPPEYWERWEESLRDPVSHDS